MRHYSKRYIWYLILVSIFSSLFFTLITFFNIFGGEEEETIIIGTKEILILVLIYVGVEIISIIYTVLQWKFTTYSFEKDSIILKKGIIFKHKKIVQYSKIHAIDYKQNIIEKLFKIKKLSIDSGATKSADQAEIVIIEDDNKILELEKEIRLKMNGEFLEEGKELVKENEPSEIFYHYSNKEKILFSLFQSITSLIVLFFFLITAIILVNSVPIEDNDPISLMIFFIIGFICLNILFLLGTYLYVVIRYYNYRVYLKDKYLIITHGLITKYNNTLPLNKIKAIKVEEGFIRRLFKLVTIKLELVGFGMTTEQNQTINYFIPFCRKHQINSFLEKLNLDFKFVEKGENSPRRALKYFYSLGLIIFSIIYASLLPIVFILKDDLNIALLIYLCIYLFITLLSILFAFIQYKNSGIYIDDKQVIVYNGILNKKNTIILNKNIIGVEKVDTYCRSKKQLASYKIHYYNNAIKNVETAHLLDAKLNRELINKIHYYNF